MAQLAPGANAAAYPPLPPAVGAAPALTPHAIIQSCAVRLGGVAVVVERNWEHWAPAHTLPRQGSPKWHGETEAEFNSFLATNNHGLGQVKRQLRCFSSLRWRWHGNKVGRNFLEDGDGRQRREHWLQGCQLGAAAR